MATEEQKPLELTTVYIKGNDFRTIFSTGIYGGTTVNGLINTVFCIDRHSLPLKTVSQLQKNSQTGLGEFKELNREWMEAPLGNSVREAQVSVLMDVLTAKNTITWLQKNIETIENAQKAQNIKQ